MNQPVYYAIDVGNRSSQLYNGNPKAITSVRSIFKNLGSVSIEGRKSGKHGRYITVDGISYGVGVTSGTQTYTVTKPPLSKQYLLALMAWEKADIIDVLYVIDSLPSIHRSQYENYLVGEHTYEFTDAKGKVRTKTVVVRQVVTIKEGLGAVKQAGVEDEDVLVFNLGGSTFDAVIFRNGVVDQQFSVNLDKEGALEYSRRLQYRLIQDGVLTFNLSSDEPLFDALENGFDYTVANMHGKSTRNIEKQAREECLAWFQEKSGLALKKMGGQVPTNKVLLTGGLSNILADHYEGHPTVTVIDNPSTANVRVF